MGGGGTTVQSWTIFFSSSGNMIFDIKNYLWKHGILWTNCLHYNAHLMQKVDKEREVKNWGWSMNIRDKEILTLKTFKACNTLSKVCLGVFYIFV